MLPNWQVQELIQLIRQRYPDWEDFAHPDFMADEISYKQATIEKAAEWLSQESLDQLLASGDYATFIDYLNRLAQDNNLLWRSVPSSGDTAVLTHPDLDQPTFCTQLRNLLYGDRPTPTACKPSPTTSAPTPCPTSGLLPPTSCSSAIRKRKCW